MLAKIYDTTWHHYTEWVKTWYFELIPIYIVIKITGTLGIFVACSTGI